MGERRVAVHGHLDRGHHVVAQSFGGELAVAGPKPMV
jgi:hypothetical protein